MGSYSFSPRAKSDLDQIWNYYAQFDPDNASRFVRELIRVFEMLAKFPSSGRLREEIRADLRSFPKGNYVIFYYPTPAGVRIMRVLHGARDHKKEFPN